MTTRKRRTTKDRVETFRRGNGECHICGLKIFPGQEWEESHPTPLAMGGADDNSNILPAHKRCHRRLTAETDIPTIARAKRKEAAHIGAKVRRGRPMPGSKASGWKKKFDGTIERRDQ